MTKDEARQYLSMNLARAKADGAPNALVLTEALALVLEELANRRRGIELEPPRAGWEVAEMNLHNRLLHVEEALVGVVPGWKVPR